MSRRPLRKEPQLLVIPNLLAVTAAFKRACTENVDLIAIELERVQINGGAALQMIAFLREPSVTLVHVMPGEVMAEIGHCGRKQASTPGDEIDQRRLLGAAESLGVNAGYQTRRRRM